MAYDEEDIKNLKSELEKLIVCLDNITANEAVQVNRYKRLKLPDINNLGFFSDFRISSQDFSGWKMRIQTTRQKFQESLASF
jgi:hypothetical protein